MVSLQTTQMNRLARLPINLSNGTWNFYVTLYAITVSALYCYHFSASIPFPTYVQTQGSGQYVLVGRANDRDGYEQKYRKYVELYELWRKEAGKLACRLNGIGPTGGFCRSKEQPRAAGGFWLAKNLIHEMGTYFSSTPGATVLDLGCGLGQYGKYLQEVFPQLTWLGLDGSEQIEEATNGFVKFTDLSNDLPLDYQHPWTFVMSIEVAEHLPRSMEPHFVYNVVKWAQKGIVMSWAKVGQGGHHHVNCQSKEYVHCAMRLLGFESDESLKARMVEAASKDTKLPHLKSTVDVFVPIPSSLLSGPTLLPLPEMLSTEFVDSYFNLTNELCGPAATKAPSTGP